MDRCPFKKKKKKQRSYGYSVIEHNLEAVAMFRKMYPFGHLDNLTHVSLNLRAYGLVQLIQLQEDQ